MASYTLAAKMKRLSSYGFVSVSSSPVAKKSRANSDPLSTSSTSQSLPQTSDAEQGKIVISPVANSSIVLTSLIGLFQCPSALLLNSWLHSNQPLILLVTVSLRRVSTVLFLPSTTYHLVSKLLLQ